MADVRYIDGNVLIGSTFTSISYLMLAGEQRPLNCVPFHMCTSCGVYGTLEVVKKISRVST